MNAALDSIVVTVMPAVLILLDHTIVPVILGSMEMGSTVKVRMHTVCRCQSNKLDIPFTCFCTLCRVLPMHSAQFRIVGE